MGYFIRSSQMGGMDVVGAAMHLFSIWRKSIPPREIISGEVVG